MHAGGVAVCTTRSLVRNFGFTTGVHPGPASQERDDFFNGRWSGADSDPRSWVLPPHPKVDDRVITAVCEAVRAASITKHLTGASPDRAAAGVGAHAAGSAPEQPVTPQWS